MRVRVGSSTGRRSSTSRRERGSSTRRVVPFVTVPRSRRHWKADIFTVRRVIPFFFAVSSCVRWRWLGYSGDVWDVQPAPRDHPWRTMKNPLGGGNGMVAHFSGTTLDAQARYAAGAKEILDRWLHGKPQDPQNVIVAEGGYATKACECRVASWGFPFVRWLMQIFFAHLYRWSTQVESKVKGRIYI